VEHLFSKSTLLLLQKIRLIKQFAHALCDVKRAPNIITSGNNKASRQRNPDQNQIQEPNRTQETQELHVTPLLTVTVDASWTGP